MNRPTLLLLDEPSLGLSPKVTEEVFARVQDIRQRGVTVLIVEQNVVDGLSISDRGYVVEHGRVTMTGQVPHAGPYIEQFDVLVNASDPEPFGILVLPSAARLSTAAVCAPTNTGTGGN